MSKMMVYLRYVLIQHKEISKTTLGMKAGEFIWVNANAIIWQRADDMVLIGEPEKDINHQFITRNNEEKIRLKINAAETRYI